MIFEKNIYFLLWNKCNTCTMNTTFCVCGHFNSIPLYGAWITSRKWKRRKIRHGIWLYEHYKTLCLCLMDLSTLGRFNYNASQWLSYIHLKWGSYPFEWFYLDNLIVGWERIWILDVFFWRHYEMLVEL